MKMFQRILWGSVLISLGVVLVLKAFNVVDFDIFFKGWWALFIIVPSFIGLFNPDDGSEKIGNIFMIILGVLLILASQEIIGFDILWKVLLPIILVLVGISIIFSNLITSKMQKKISQLNKKDSKDHNVYMAIFSGQKEKVGKEEFKGCNMTTVFGGMELDISNAIISKDVVINANTMFGGSSIVVPKNAKVQYNSSSLFGGVENKANNGEGDGPTIYVNASCFCGGIEIVDEKTKKQR